MTTYSPPGPVVEDMIRYAEKALRYTAGLTWGQFEAEAMVQDAVIWNILVIGEASKRLETAVKATVPQVPWRDVARMRDKMIHSYFNIKLDRVWDVVVTDLPPLVTELRTLLARLTAAPPDDVTT